MIRVVPGGTPALILAAAMAGALGCTSSYESAWDQQPSGQSGGESADASRHDALVAQGDAAWGGRDDGDRGRAASAAWEQAGEADAGDYETLAKLSRGYYFLADGHLRFDDPDALAETHQIGIQRAEQALAVINPEFAQRMAAGELFENVVGMLDERAVPALYWRASNLGRWARNEGFATLLSYKDEVRAVMARCLELERYYYFAGPDRYFGAFFSIAPSYAGGDLERSREHFEESIRRQPDYFGTRVLMAETYAVQAQDRDVYQTQLQYVIDGDPEALAPVAPENRVEQRKAREMLAEIDDLFE
ncbi:MAG: TRAP transporter TatT component family protein [Sandaracinaceae bacterium]